MLLESSGSMHNVHGSNGYEDYVAVILQHRMRPYCNHAQTNKVHIIQPNLRDQPKSLNIDKILQIYCLIIPKLLDKAQGKSSDVE